MSGIVGYFDPHQKLPKDSLCLMREALTPALNENSIILNECWAGVAVDNFNSLSSVINDTGLSVALLGELEEADSEKKYQALFRADKGMLRDLNGSFLAVVVDSANRKLKLITDRFGGYTCYIARYRGATLFATQIKSILNVLPPATLDQQSISMMLSIGEVIGNRTLVNEVNTLPAASITSLAGGQKEEFIYWSYLHEQNFSATRKNLIDEAGSALYEAVKSSCQKHEHIKIPLSGGLDSRFLLGLANQQEANIDAYTWGVPGCRDLRFAKEVTGIAKVPHQTYSFSGSYLESLANQGVWLTEGNIPAVHFHVLPFVNEVTGNNSVLLDGFAGDATLGGNFVGDAWLNNGDLVSAGGHLWAWRLSSFLPSVLHDSLMPFHHVAKDEFVKLYGSYPGEGSMDKAMGFLLDNRVRRITSCGTEIFRSKIMVKQPFMNVEMMNATSKIPHKWRVRHRFYLDVMSKFAPDVAKARWQRTCLPASSPYWMTLGSLAAQKTLSKLGPLSKMLSDKSPSQFDVWFRTSLKAYVEGILFSEVTIERGVLPIKTLEKAWELHQQGKIDASNLIGSALTIELFSRLFIDDLKGSIDRS